MATAPFQRKIDKAAYIIGTNIFVLFAYVIAKFPHTFCYDYTTFVMSLLFIYRYYEFYFNGYHMFLTDWCYIANFVLLYHINFAP